MNSLGLTVDGPQAVEGAIESRDEETVRQATLKVVQAKIAKTALRLHNAQRVLSFSLSPHSLSLECFPLHDSATVSQHEMRAFGTVTVSRASWSMLSSAFSWCSGGCL